MTDLEAWTPTVSKLDRPEVTQLRATYRSAGTAAGLTLLAFAARLALETIPSGPNLQKGFAAVDLAARVGAGEDIDPWALSEVYHDEQDEGIEPIAWTYKHTSHESAWLAVLCVVGAASWHLSTHRGESPYSLFEDFDDPDVREQECDVLNEISGLDTAALSAACAYVQAYDSKASEGWGQPLRIEELCHATGRG